MKSDLAYIYYILSSMLEAAVPLNRVLNTVTNSSKGKFKRTFSRIEKNVSTGDTIPEAMARYPKIFAPIDITLTRAADVSGNLPHGFKLLSKWYEFRKRLRNLLISGMMLPVVILHIAAFIFPAPSLILSKITVAEYFLCALRVLSLLYIPAIIIFLIIKLTPSKGIFKKNLDRLVLRIPVLGKAVYNLSLSRYARSFHMLYSAGVPIINCSELVNDFTGNLVVTDLLKDGFESAKKGNMVSEGFSKNLPKQFTSLWQVGEESGKLEDSTKRLADMYTETAEFWFGEFVRWLPRVIYFFVMLLLAYMILKMIMSLGSSYQIG